MHSLAGLWNHLHVHVQFSCVSGERVSVLYNDIWVCNRGSDVSWNYLFSWQLQKQRERRSHLLCYPGTNMYLCEERTSDSCLSPRALSSPHTGLIWSPAKDTITAQRCSTNGTPETWHILIFPVLGPPQFSKHNSLPYNSEKSFLQLCVFLVHTFFSVSCCISCLKMATGKEISQQGHLVYPKL